MADDSAITNPIDIDTLTKQILGALVSQLPDVGVHKAVVNAHADSRATWMSALYKAALGVAGKSGQTMHDVEEIAFPFIAAFVAPVVAGLFGAEVNAGAFTQRLASGGGEAAARSLVDNFVKAISGGTEGPIAPSTAGASRIATAAVGASLESTFNAVATEMISDLLPEIGPHFTALTAIPEEILRALGVGRLVRRALSPLVDAACATPAKWYYAQRFQQNLLSASEVARQVARGRWSIDQAKEELSRQGYSDDRIEAVLNAAARFLSASDLGRLVRAQQLDASEAITQLRSAGYDEDTAAILMTLEKLAFIEQLDVAMADAAVTAYADGRIDEGTLGGFCSGTTITEQHKAQLVELAHARRICNAKPLTSAEAKAAVIAGVLALPDYRAALAQENRTPDAIDVLDLMLRAELDTKKSAADHKAELAAAKATAATQKLADAQAKKDAADAKAAIQRLGPPAQLENAYIRGLIPIDRVEQIYSARYDAGAVDALIADLQDKRQAYVAQQQRAADAAKRAESHGANAGQLEAAYLAGVIDVDRYRQSLLDQHVDAADVDVIVATATAKLQAKQAADAAHAQALAAAKIKHVDLATLELLVRRGHRTLDDFRAALTSIGYDDIAQAALVERLQIQMSDDQAAAKVKADAAAKLAAKGLSLDQFHRAVVLGVKTVNDYTGFLLANGFTADAVQTLAAVAQADADEADAARKRRAAADARAQTPALPLAELARAVKLGLVPVDVYTARLTAAGYSADDIAIEQDLLTQEIADVQAARAKRAATDAAAGGRGLTLVQVAAAVRNGELTPDDYRARAIALGLSADDADTLTRVLEDELAAAHALQTRKAALAAEDATRELARADFEKAVKDGLQSIDDYAAWLREKGYAADDAALLVAELQQTLADAAAKAGG
jgi:hypothetical protein